ncbi:hypothetical protein QE381_003264 [Microbacterium sp. SORGH_AS 888]|nr:hypothetical protein [Microbacterium sp. SORGH_AS_0888]
MFGKHDVSFTPSLEFAEDPAGHRTSSGARGAGSEAGAI